jgi:hypothetical protein
MSQGTIASSIMSVSSSLGSLSVTGTWARSQDPVAQPPWQSTSTRAMLHRGAVHVLHDSKAAAACRLAAQQQSQRLLQAALTWVPCPE